jgi:hypothetical protein
MADCTEMRFRDFAETWLQIIAGSQAADVIEVDC